MRTKKLKFYLWHNFFVLIPQFWCFLIIFHVFFVFHLASESVLTQVFNKCAQFFSKLVSKHLTAACIIDKVLLEGFKVIPKKLQTLRKRRYLAIRYRLAKTKKNLNFFKILKHFKTKKMQNCGLRTKKLRDELNF